MTQPLDTRCNGCGKRPHELAEYSTEMVDYPPGVHTPTEYVRREEGTYNRSNGHFLCTTCYLAAGMPTAPGGWKAP